MGLKIEPAFRMAQAIDLAVKSGDKAGQDQLLAAIATEDAGITAHAYVDQKGKRDSSASVTDTFNGRALTKEEVFDFAIRNGFVNAVEFLLQKDVSADAEVRYDRPSCNGSDWNPTLVPGRPNSEPAVVAAVRLMISHHKSGQDKNDKVEAGLLIYAALLHAGATNDSGIAGLIAAIPQYNRDLHAAWHHDAMDRTRG